MPSQCISFLKILTWSLKLLNNVNHSLLTPRNSLKWWILNKLKRRSFWIGLGFIWKRWSELPGGSFWIPRGNCQGWRGPPSWVGELGWVSALSWGYLLKNRKREGTFCPVGSSRWRCGLSLRVWSRPCLWARVELYCSDRVQPLPCRDLEHGLSVCWRVSLSCFGTAQSLHEGDRAILSEKSPLVTGWHCLAGSSNTLVWPQTGAVGATPAGGVLLLVQLCHFPCLWSSSSRVGGTAGALPCPKLCRESCLKPEPGQNLQMAFAHSSQWVRGGTFCRALQCTSCSWAQKHCSGEGLGLKRSSTRQSSFAQGKKWT